MVSSSLDLELLDILVEM
uniref:Uncharacterized protein n=1 Tax=Rhizophora mucronata TaxID=61149 RepID=A0A2P2QP63_RHIMU